MFANTTSQEPALVRYPAVMVVALSVLISACGTRDYRPSASANWAFLDRAVFATEAAITVNAALPDAAETLEVTGLDLYAQGIQPVWLKIHNGSDENLRLAQWSIDRDYFSPMEVAYTNRRPFSDDGYRVMERWFYDNAMPRRVPSGETRSGFVFTNLTPGTKGFNLDLFSVGTAHNFTFFIDLPGFVPDYRLVDLDGLYADEALIPLAGEDLLELLTEGVPCCATDAQGVGEGRPLNLLFVATTQALRRSLMRGQWRETSVSEKQELREDLQYFDGRVADGRFYLARTDADAKIILNVWLSPWRIDGVPVWVAQTFFREDDRPIVAALRRRGVVERSELLARFVGETVSADVDSAQTFVVQNLWYNQSVTRAGFAPFMPSRSVDNPGTTFDGYGYVTRGDRVVVFLSGEPATYADVELLFGARDAVQHTDGEADR